MSSVDTSDDVCYYIFMTTTARDAYIEAVKMMQDAGIAFTVEDVLQGVIEGVYVPRPIGMTALLNIMLNDEDFMGGFND